VLTLEKIRFKNVLSFGDNWTTIDFDNQNSILVQGANGSGKSAALLDTLSYGLYGRPFRKVNKPNIVNYKNKKDLIVEVWFKTQTGATYHIIRGMNPQIFEIYENDVLINQNSALRDYQEILEKQILKLDFQSFTQIVILGKATYIAFLRLQPQDRRKFIENVLNLTIFGYMNDINKLKVNELKMQLQIIKQDLSMTKKEIELTQKHIQDFESEVERQQQEHQKMIDAQIDGIQSQIQDLQNERAAREAEMLEIDGDLDSLKKKIELCYEYQSKIQTKLSDIRKRIQFFEKSSICPTCENEINPEVKVQKISEFDSREQELSVAQDQLSTKIDALVSSVQEIQTSLQHNAMVLQSIQLIDSRISQNNDRIRDLEKQRSNQVSTNIDKINDLKQELERLLVVKEEKGASREDINARLDCHEFITLMLKDTGIKSSVIRSHIPQIVSVMNGYLRALGLFVKFDLNENFEEKLFSRGIDDQTYSAFSEGEKLRIDLAMLLTWREICKRKNNMSVNFLVFDEILDNSIDLAGIDNLLSIFKILKDEGLKVIMISHSERWEDRFDEIWTVEKRSGFSVLLKEAKG
jgi:DNA repair exonuclease SbcCD ATPase subunit